ncbi:MAG: polysaccharide deacetylase family protein [Acidobacteria bacterium]|nr:polysaccharide deacetylase family protein [Acidobacteriota bacterium]
MLRRDLFKAFTVAGAFIASGRPASTAAASAQAEGSSGPSAQFPDWPFQEMRIPYRERAGKVRWPNGGPLCVHAYVAAEWRWNRPSQGSGAGQGPGGKVTQDLSLHSDEDQYVFTVGIWRAIKLLDKFDIKATIFPSAGMVERYPDLFRELYGKGHEIVARSYDQSVPTTQMTPDAERREIQRSAEIIEKVTGKRPVGWQNPGAQCTGKTPEILADEGYLWTSDLKGDDLPYGIKTRNGKKIVVIPHRSRTSNDNAVFPEGAGIRGFRSGQEAVEFLKDSFDSYYKLGQEEYPGSLLYGIHTYRSCIPDRISVHERMFDYMKKFEGIWWARYADMAEHWMKNYLQG